MQGQIRERLHALKNGVAAKQVPLSSAIEEIAELFDEFIAQTERRLAQREREEID